MQDESTKLGREQIYVPLALVQRTKPEKRNKGEYSPEAGTDLYEAQYDKKQRFEHEAFLTQILERGEGKTKGKRIALIGEPGAGKTTLLQCIAFWVLEKNLGFPIWISLADLQRSAHRGDLSTYLLENWLSKAVPPKQLTRAKEELTTQIQQGRVWLLLDGVDEVAVSGMQTLKNLSRQFSGWISQLRVVLTCRLNVWQADRNDLEDFETYRLLDFDYPKQVHQFIDNWFGNLTSDCPSEKRGSKAERLKAQLDEAERGRLRNLVQNPLRLMLLCSTWESEEGNLPQTKAGLYKQFVNKIYKWKYNRFPINDEEQEKLNNALGRLALKDIQEGSSRFRLLESFIKKELGAPDDKNSSFYKALQLGWLNHVGIADESPSQEKVYTFYHATFQEYFAALAIDDWGFFQPRDHKNKPVKDADNKDKPYRIFEPQWKEVILLWLGREEVEKEQKEEFIKALVEFRDGCGGFYQHRAYFLAAAVIAEFGECSRSDEVVKQIVRWSSDYGPLQDGAEAALQQTHRAKAIAALLNLIATSEGKYYTRMLALESLGKIAVGNESAKAALLGFIANSQNEIRNRMQAAESLGKIDPGNKTAIAALINFIDRSEFEYFHSMAASHLGEIGVGNEGAIDALVNLIATSEDEYTYWEAAESLGKIAVGNESAIDALINLIASSKEESTRRQAAESLEQIAVGNEGAINALVNLIATSQDESTRRKVASRLGQIAVGNQGALDALDNLIDTSEDESTRCQAASSLGQIDPDNKSALDALDNLIDTSEDESTRCQAASSLGQIAVGNKGAIDALLKLIATSKNESIRQQAASSLGQIAVGNKGAINALVNLITTSHDFSTRWQAESSLGQIAVGNEGAIDALIKLINTAHDYSPLSSAASSLEKILPADRIAKAVTALRYNFKPDKSRDRAIWPCAQNMSYSAFYEAWHPSFDIKIAIRYLYPWWPVLCLFLVVHILVRFNVLPNVKSPTDIQRQQQIR